MYTTYLYAQILPPLNSYTNEQATHVCMTANSSSVWFSQGCFLEHVRCPQVLGLSLIGSAGVNEKPLGCKLPHDYSQ